MSKFFETAIPHVGIHLDYTPVRHFVRDLLVALILWHVGFRGFQLVFSTMLVSGFFEAGNGICYSCDGSHAYFDFLDFLPSTVAGFLILGAFSGHFDLGLLGTMALIYTGVIVVLLVLNVILGRRITI